MKSSRKTTQRLYQYMKRTEHYARRSRKLSRLFQNQDELINLLLGTIWQRSQGKVRKAADVRREEGE